MIKVIDNFLDSESFLKVKNTFFPLDLNLEKDNFSWNYQKGIVKNPKFGITDYDEYDWMYTRELFSSENGLKFDKYYYLLNTILNQLNVGHLFDVRANLLVPTNKHIYHDFHVDRTISHIVALFYITTCNGFTVFKTNDQIDCLENRMVIFDGSIEHCSVTSTNHPRCVININYLEKK